jgi:8-amino-7-oxononanoate synthase
LRKADGHGAKLIMTILSAQRSDLDGLARIGRLRKLAPNAGLDFASNDYLGLASSLRLRCATTDALARGVPVGSGGSRLLRGNHPEHEALEIEAAAYFGAESALYFSSGYAANTAIFGTLPQRGDLIVFDALVHASVHEGMRLTRAACRLAVHNRADAVEDEIATWRAQGGIGRVWIAVESLYSMDGDFAPLADFEQVAARHDAFLIIDEAHATGVFGEGGRGLAASFEGQDNVITLRTCGKALGCEGALICAPRVITDILVNRGRPFIFSTAPSPLMASAVRAALHVLDDEPERRQALGHLIAAADAKLTPLGVTPPGSQIIPVILGEDIRAMSVAADLQTAGFDVRGIRPPTVAAGTARLRIALTLNVTVADVDALGDALAEALT